MSVTSLDSIAPATTTPLLGLSLAELTTWVQQQGQPAYRGKQLYQWIYQQGARSLADITVFSKQWRETVKDVRIGRSIVHHRAVASDGTVKYLLQLQDGQIVEAVGIPSAKRLTVFASWLCDGLYFLRHRERGLYPPSSAP
jgi:23S rRNA (adenine2503-C2)-methyltransferase